MNCLTSKELRRMKNVPDIRFKGTASIWEYKKFSYFIERVSMSRKAGEIPGIEYEDIISGEGVFNKNIFTKQERGAICKW